SVRGKYRSVSEGMYRTGTLMERSAASTLPPNGGVLPTSLLSQVRICRMRLLASAPGMKCVLKWSMTWGRVLPREGSERHSSRRHHSCEKSHAVQTREN